MSKTLKVRLTDNTIRGRIRNICSREEKTFPIEANSTFRVSSIPYLCAREEVLASRYGVNRPPKFDKDAIFNFEYGTAIHRQLQNFILPTAGCIVGIWRCLHCGHNVGEVGNLVARPGLCPSCDFKSDSVLDSEDWMYVESYLLNDSYRVGGHPDGFLSVPWEDGVGVLEVKSISQRGATLIKHAPSRAHVVQANMYMWLSDLEWATILYWIKGLYGITCLREFRIDRDDELIYKVKLALESMWNGIEGGKIPDRICAEQDCDRSKGCELSDLCWRH